MVTLYGRTVTDRENPYLGPRPFTREDGHRFFGRSLETSELFSLVAAHRTVLVYAQSGAGKTSLLNAKLIPQLEQAKFDVLPTARVTAASIAAPPAAANVYVHNCVRAWLGREPAQEVTLRTALGERETRREASGDAWPRVVILDQFEELFTSYPECWKQRQGFFEQLAEAMASEPTLRVLFAMREDFLGHVERYEHLIAEDLRTRYRLERLRAEGALEAIVKPLEGTGVSFAARDLPAGPGTVATLLLENLLRVPALASPGDAEAAYYETEHVEAVQLQVVCYKLFRDLPLDTNEIGENHVATVGDVDQALREFYEEALKEASYSAGIETDSLRQWFDTKLITEFGTRGLVFRGREDTAGIANAVVDKLDALHLIRPEIRGSDYWYEISHDRFIRPIKSANDEWRARMQKSAQDALERKRRQELQDVWIRRGAAAGIVIGCVILGLAVFAFRQRSEALKQKTEALTQATEALKQKADAEQAREELKAANADLNSQVTVLNTKLAVCPGTSEPGVQGTGPVTSYSVPELAKLYDFPDGIDGSGQTIALVDLGSGYVTEDLKRYFEQLKLSEPTVRWVPVDGVGKNPGHGQIDASVTVALEVAGATAPGAAFAVYGAPNTNKGFVDAINAAAAAHPSVLLLVWGQPEASWSSISMAAMNKALEAAVRAGVTVVAAAGDNGASDGVSDGHPHVDFPSSSPWALAVGGTTLTATGGKISREVVWSGTGGGVSDIQPLPDWQARANVPIVDPTGTRRRGVPDVVANANPETGYRVVVSGEIQVVAGTTMSAALWAGLIAVINHGLAERGLTHNIGYLNPLLYTPIGPKFALRAITEGNNGSQKVPGYSAGPGWNPASGWGSPDGKKLLDALWAELGGH